jgi:GntR family transcriptional regulator, transcriptional repressor for pyruvate dehydrogenase complex
MFERLHLPPAYKVVSSTLESEILSGRLVAGQRLPSETELAEQFGVNRHTVREGIRILEQNGLVRREAGRRLFVALPHYAEYAPRASQALVMQRVTFRELWEVSVELEPTAAFHAATQVTPEMLDRLRENIEATEAALRRGDSIIPLDVAFHTLVAEAAGNKALMLAREPVSALFYPALETLFAHPSAAAIASERLLQAHRNVVAGLEARDADQAREWMRKHLVDFRRGYARAGLDMNGAVQHSAIPARR